MHFFISSLRRRLLPGLVLGVAGIVLAVTPAGRWLEEELGLSWLFTIRGPIAAPADVVVVSIDQASSKQLGLPNKPRLWPRNLHADLVNRLHQHGASVVFFDIIFEEVRDAAHNQQLAAALLQANNVILFQYLQREIVPAANRSGDVTEAHIEKLHSPTTPLREAAFGLAPFPLPKVPAQVNHFLLYKPELGNVPTMPVVALQTHALPVYDELIRRIQAQPLALPGSLPATAAQLRQRRAIQESATTLREFFMQHPVLAGELIDAVEHDNAQNTANRALLLALLETYRAPHSAYLNFYGPPRTITTIPYYQLLQDQSPPDLRGKAVFVGFSEELQPEQKDGFYTVYTSERSGLDISGVEIGATAFANLLHQQLIIPPAAWLDITVLLLWGLLLGVVLRSLSGSWQIPAAMLLGGLYLIVVYQLFAQQQLWLSLSIPLLWQLPLAAIGSLLWTYFDVQRERRNIRAAFGLHLPIDVVDQLAGNLGHLTAPGQPVQGVVLATDAEQYTRLAETLPPGELHELLNRYYGTVFTPIREKHGIVSDVVGDAVLALWAAPQQTAVLRQQAIEAALAIHAAVDHFNHTAAPHRLPTRMGLHCGAIVMGHVGAADHYEYRAIGDIVNTASRIEALNKLLGTRILVSSELIDGLPDVISREVGTFLLAGKQQPITLHELLGSSTQPASAGDYTGFATALAEFRQQQWDKAHNSFTAYLHQHGDDGPARYYLGLCEQYRNQPPVLWNGVIALAQK